MTWVSMCQVRSRCSPDDCVGTFQMAYIIAEDAKHTTTPISLITRHRHVWLAQIGNRGTDP
jgi:hypothetical protein